jgi:serine phosphatase RsbU (regulator of sigma subunit)
MKYLLTFILLVTLLPSLFSQTKVEELLIDSLKKIITNTPDDSIKIQAYWKWDNLIFTTDSKLDIELNQKIYHLSHPKFSLLKTKRDTFFCLTAAKALNNIGTIYIEMAGKQKLAIQNLESSLKFAKQVNNLELISQIHNNIGIILSKNDDLENALKHYNICKKILNKIGGKKIVSIALSGNIGYIYFQKSEILKNNESIEQSFKYADSAINILSQNIIDCDEFPNNKLIQRHKINALNSLSEHYNSINKSEKAKYYSIKAIKISEDIQDSYSISKSYERFGRIFYHLKDYKKAIYHCSKGWKYAIQVGSLEGMEECSNTLYLSYKNTHQSNKALKFYEHYINIRDSINNKANQKAAIEQVFRYEYKKQAEQDSLKHIYSQQLKDAEIEKNKLDLIQQKTQKIGLIIFVFLMSIFTIYLTITIRNKQKTNQIITNQNIELETQRKKIHDSITYAENIQKSLLPDLNEIKKYIPGFSILFEPKDIVSGDFYWFHQEDNISYIALSDCTGHGIPGAFMSMIGSTQLKDIIIDSKESNLALILEQLDIGIRNLLKQHDQDASEDGMEIAIIKLDLTNNTLEFAGANQNLIIVKDDIITLKGSLRSIGGWVKKRSRLREFTTHKIELENIKAVYLTTDGLEDQFGGPNQKKFNTERVLSLIEKMDSQPNMLTIKNELKTWQGHSIQIDDITVIGIKL